MTTDERTQALRSRWLERQEQLLQLLSWLAPDSGGPALPYFLVYGKESSGKSVLVRDVMRQLQLPHAYIQCSSVHAPRDVFSNILSQLAGRKRKREDGFCSRTSCDSAADFAVQLAALHKPSSTPPTAPYYIILDNAHLTARTPLLPSLLAALESASAATCGTFRAAAVLISRHAWGSGEFMNATRHMPALHLPPYTLPQLESLLARWRPPQADPQLYTAFIQAEVLGAFGKLTSSCRDLQALAEHLWPTYTAPLQNERVRHLAGPQLHQALHQALLPHVKKLLGSYEPASGCVRLLDSASGRTVLDLELPYMAKWLLLAAYLASRNKASTDRRVFGQGPPGSSGGGRRGSRRGGALAHQRQGDAAAEAAMRGPHLFSLHRMLAIFRSLLHSHFGTGDAAANAAAAGAAAAGDDEGAAAVNLMQGLGPTEGQATGEAAVVLKAAESAEVLTHVTSLVSLRLLSLVSEDALQAPRYRCNAPEELVRLVATNVDMQLHHFLCTTF